MPIRYVTGARGAAEIAGGIERAVADGSLAPGDRLPTVRELAARLGVAPGTVSAAYRRLSSRGIVTGHGRQGTRVTAGPPLAGPAPVPPPPGTRDLASGHPDPALLPDLAPALRRLRPSTVTWGDPQPDLPAFVELAAARLRDDGYPAGRVLAVNGALDGVERALEAHLRPGDRVAIEDPGFPRVLDLVATLGLVAVPVPVDDEGLDPGSLTRALTGGVEAVVVTPRAQNPTGAALSAGRARQLRRALRDHPHVLVVEDDHAGAIAGADVHPLVTADRARWAVVRSVSKALGPDLRLAAFTGDDRSVDRVAGRLRAGPGWVSHLLQALAVDLATDPTATRRVDRAARTYAERRAALVDALAGHGLAAHGRSGLNVWVPVPAEAPVVAGLAAAGWAVAAGERFRSRTGPGVRITVASLAPADARRLAADLAAIVLPARGAAGAV